MTANVEHNTLIRSWEEGDNVQGFALLSKKERRQDRNGRDYLDLELADNTGSIAGKVWAASPAMESDFEAHQFVAFRGSVRSYRDTLQLNVDHCRPTTEDDRKYGFNEKDLMPSTLEDVGDLYARLQRALDQVQRPVLERLIRETLEIHGESLRKHPAAKLMHHAYLGGLLEHTCSMAELAVKVCGHYDYLDQDLILVGIIFHDLGKIHELGEMPANDYTLSGRMIGHVVMGRDMLRDRCAAIEDFPQDLQLHLEHLVLSHQGKKEYSSPVAPMTAEALTLHFIDDLDSKLNQLLMAKHNSDEPMQYMRGMGRFMYLGESKDETAEDETTESSAD